MSVRVVTPSRSTRCSPGRCSSRRRRTSSKPSRRKRRAPCPGARGRPGRGRHPHRHVHRPRTRPTREVLIGGTAYAGEIKKSIFTLLNDRLPHRRRLPDALLGERRRRGRRRDLLRALRHRQDDSFGRSRAASDRRRRARLGRRRRLQLRGRLLREGDPPLGRGRARDLRDHPRVRDAARERRRSTRTARSTSTSDAKTENTRGRLPARADLELRCRRSSPATRERRLPDRRRLRRDAADRAARRPQARYHFLSGFTAQARGHRDRRHRAAAAFSPCFGAPVPAAAARGLRAAAAARSWPSTGRPSGS